jgi:hypothetical protein
MPSYRDTMNWLIGQVDRAPTDVSSLDAVALELPRTTLRRVLYEDLATILPVQLARNSGSRRLVQAGFALLENAADAQVRYERAEPSWSPHSGLFTVAIDDESGSILYLPQDTDTGSEDFQLFTFVRPTGVGAGSGDRGRLARLRGLGAFGDGYAIVEVVETIEPEACSDGPCAEWGEGCGEGCRCQRFEVPAPPGRGRVYGLICG